MRGFLVDEKTRDRGKEIKEKDRRFGSPIRPSLAAAADSRQIDLSKRKTRDYCALLASRNSLTLTEDNGSRSAVKRSNRRFEIRR